MNNAEINAELAEALHSLIVAVLDDNDVPRNCKAYNATDRAREALRNAGWKPSRKA